MRSFLRQKKITKFFNKFKHKTFIEKLLMFELSLINILVQSTFSLLKSDLHYLIDNKFIFLNGVLCKNYSKTLGVSDRLQIAINKNFYVYNIFSKNWLRKFIIKARKRLKYKANKVYNASKKRSYHTPKWVLRTMHYKNTMPKYLEISYQILTLIVIKWPNNTNDFNATCFKFVSYQNLSLYNWKRTV